MYVSLSLSLSSLNGLSQKKKVRSVPLYFRKYERPYSHPRPPNLNVKDKFAPVTLELSEKKRKFDNHFYDVINDVEWRVRCHYNNESDIKPVTGMNRGGWG